VTKTLPAKWNISPLGSVADGFLSGGTPSTKNDEYWQGTVPWITSKWLNSTLYLDSGEKFISNDALKQSATKVVPRYNLIFATRVGVGKVAVNVIDLAINQDLAGILVDSSRHDIRFLAYQLRSDRIQQTVASHKRGATIQGITRDNLKDLEIYLPPLDEQRKIAGVLGVVQRAIEQQERLIALTTELKKALLRQLFSHGLRGEPQKQTEIGPMPESWTPTPLGICCNILSGSLSYTDFLKMVSADEEGAFECMGIKVSDMNLSGNENRFVTANLVKRLPVALAHHKLIPPNTIVFPKRGAAIATNKKRLTTTWTVLDPNLIGICAKDALDADFLFHWSHTFDLRKITDPGPTPQLNKKDLIPVLIPLPKDINEQREIADAIYSADRKLTLHKHKHTAFTALFRTLLHLFMTAQIRIHDLDLSELETLRKGNHESGTV
jgi:type I restriction enzyme S subunit